ncbi:MAG TPA: type II secretion system protein [Bryobacteraceae bacterium]|jgi:general secretion pathway protein G|nr:type II secretion system protein [Bryobacteraceae bacterium]
MRNGRRANQRGLTLLELIVALTLLAVLSTLMLPLARIKIRTQREADLRWDLELMRKAIDRYKDNCDQGYFGPPKLGSDCYPESLEVLVEGKELANDPNSTKLKFLRAIPKDPFTGTYEWGMRSTEDDPKTKSWGGQAVFDIYTKTEDKAPDGTPYAEW